MIPKLVISDIDGVWTDGGMYYDQLGNELKKFNTSDSAGVLFLRILEIPFAIITGERTDVVLHRANKLKVKYLFQGVKDKVQIAEDLCEKLKISLEEVAYIGDDLNDVKLLRKVGLSACPDNAPDYIKSEVDVVIPVKGGDGAFRAFVETILHKNGLMDKVLDQYMDGKN